MSSTAGKVLSPNYLKYFFFAVAIEFFALVLSFPAWGQIGMHRSANASSSVFEMLCGLIFLALQFPTLYVNVALMLLITVEHAVAEDNRVMGRSVATATHTKAVLGVQPTHKKITATFWDLHLFDENGLIIETWNLMDNLAIMQQIGLLK